MRFLLIYLSYKVILASDYVGDRMCGANPQAVVDRIKLLQEKDDHGLHGKLFERFTHRVLPHGSTEDYPLLATPAGGGRGVTVRGLLSYVPVLINSIGDIASRAIDSTCCLLYPISPSSTRS